MTHLKVILVIIVGLAVIVLAVQNHQAMSQSVQFRINPVFFQEMRSGDISIYQVTVISFLLGVISTGAYGIFERFRLKRKIKSLTKNLDDKDKELSSLRNLPITYDGVSAEEPEKT